ncbi:MAG: ABC transporter permease [Bacteroidota bacterium]
MSVSWILKMAWRDSRGSRRRLLLFLSSMVLGVGALVAIQALGTSLQQAVDSEARTLLGADLVLENEQPFPAPIEALADSLGGEQARRTSFASMVYFPTQEGTRLATVRATEPGYPFYGVVETTPPGAADLYHDGDRALVDAALMRQFGVAVGDSVRVGQRLYEVAGQIDKTTSESGAISFVSPLVYIPYARLDTTLTQQGSRVEYEWYFRLDDSVDPEALRSDIRPLLRENQVGSDTVGERAEDWSEGLSNLYRFLGLVGFVALLLGGLGVASAVHVYVKQRIETVAVLRCLGASGPSTFSIYLTQAAAMGLLSGTLGTLIGVGLQLYLPRLVQDILPIQIDFLFSWSAVALGLGVGLGTTLLFALLPLLTVRRVSPLRAIRAAYEAQDQGPDPLRWVVYGLIGLAIGVFAVVQAPQPALGIGFAVGIGVVFGLLALTAQGLILLVRRFFPSGWPYAWRQGLANLYRPNNQTLILMLSLGLGTFLIMTLWLSQQVLLDQIQVAGGEGRPDLVLFDVQPDQQPGVREAIEAQALPVLAEVPIVTMRLAAINGRTVEELREDPNTPTSWAHRREYRSSYREALTKL